LLGGLKGFGISLWPTKALEIQKSSLVLDRQIPVLWPELIIGAIEFRVELAKRHRNHLCKRQLVKILLSLHTSSRRRRGDTVVSQLQHDGGSIKSRVADGGGLLLDGIRRGDGGRTSRNDGVGRAACSWFRADGKCTRQGSFERRLHYGVATANRGGETLFGRYSSTSSTRYGNFHTQLCSSSFGKPHGMATGAPSNSNFLIFDGLRSGGDGNKVVCLLFDHRLRDRSTFRDDTAHTNLCSDSRG
jgi:hypothetical protein